VVAGHVPLMFGDSNGASADQLAVARPQCRSRNAPRPQIFLRRPVCYVASSWQGAAAGPPADPAKPEELVIMAEPDIQKDFADRGVIPVVSPPPEALQGYVRSEIVRWGKVVEQAGATGSQ
jgi:hypothetical protein